jgi:predicted Zn-dependent protease
MAAAFARKPAMRITIPVLILVLALVPVSTLGQLQKPPTPPQAYIMANIMADRIANSLRKNPSIRGNAGYSIPEFKLVVTDEQVVNAYADTRTNTVRLPARIVEFYGSDKGELAYVIAHEIGHLQDRDCLARGIQQGLRNRALQRKCEESADSIAIQYMMAAGYSPFDAAAAMGRLMMLTSDHTSVLGIAMGRFTSNHPVDLDRIARMRDDARQVCIDRPEICAQFKSAN